MGRMRLEEFEPTLPMFSQLEGKRKVGYYEFRGEPKSLREISDILGISYNTIYRRSKLGTPFDLPLGHNSADIRRPIKPVRSEIRGGKRTKLYDYDGDCLSVAELAKMGDLPYKLIYRRIKVGLPMHRIVERPGAAPTPNPEIEIEDPIVEEIVEPTPEPSRLNMDAIMNSPLGSKFFRKQSAVKGMTVGYMDVNLDVTFTKGSSGKFFQPVKNCTTCAHDPSHLEATKGLVCNLDHIPEDVKGICGGWKESDRYRMRKSPDRDGDQETQQ